MVFKKGDISPFKGIPRSEEVRIKIGLAQKGIPKPYVRGEKHGEWKGDNVSYSGLHKWVAYKLGSPRKCKDCGTIKAPRFVWANISKEYKRDLEDWVRLCVSCHMKFDKTWLKRSRDASGRFL